VRWAEERIYPCSSQMVKVERGVTVWKLSATSQPPNHQADHGRVDERFRACAQPLVIFAHPPVLVCPRTCPLHHPSAGQSLVSSVVTIEPGTSIVDAARRMIQEEKGPLPVVEGDSPVAMVTDRDIIARVVAEGRDPNSVTVDDIATREGEMQA
jgi:hypothetical protein